MLTRWFSTRGDFAPQDIWQYLEIFSIVRTKRGSYWHLVGSLMLLYQTHKLGGLK